MTENPAHFAHLSGRRGYSCCNGSAGRRGFVDFLDSADYRADVHQCAPPGSPLQISRKESSNYETHLFGVCCGWPVGLSDGGVRAGRPSPCVRRPTVPARPTGFARRHGWSRGCWPGSRRGDVSVLHHPRTARLLRSSSRERWSVRIRGIRDWKKPACGCGGGRRLEF